MIIYFIFLLGLIIGSFINVCVYRIPKEESILYPRSHCPECKKIINWYDNIPVLSFILLKGKCRTCKNVIPLRYPLIEILTGLAFVLVAFIHPFNIHLIVYLYLTFVFITVSVIDLSDRIIPDVFSFSLIIIGLLYSPFNPLLGFYWKGRMLNAFLGGLTGFSFLFAISFIGKKIMRQEVMGGGDIKLLAGIGAIFGISKTLLILFIASLVGSILCIILIITKRINRHEYIPFGPFLAFGAYINLFIPDSLFILRLFK